MAKQKTKYFIFKNKEYKVDNQGYLIDPGDWDEDFALGMAPRVKIGGGLSDAHWKVIHFIRNTFEQMNTCPLVYIACRNNNIGLGDLKKLFPTGYHRGACKLAGITYRQWYFQRYLVEEKIRQHEHDYEFKTYSIDTRGYLVDTNQWDENFAILKAYEMKMVDYLTDRHWSIIYYLRRKFESDKAIPTIYEVCEENGLKLDEFEQMFPDGYHRGAIKIAGLRHIE